MKHNSYKSTTALVMTLSLLQPMVAIAQEPVTAECTPELLRDGLACIDPITKLLVLPGTSSTNSAEAATVDAEKAAAAALEEAAKAAAEAAAADIAAAEAALAKAAEMDAAAAADAKSANDAAAQAAADAAVAETERAKAAEIDTAAKAARAAEVAAAEAAAAAKAEADAAAAAEAARVKAAEMDATAADAERAKAAEASARATALTDAEAAQKAAEADAAARTEAEAAALAATMAADAAAAAAANVAALPPCDPLLPAVVCDPAKSLPDAPIASIPNVPTVAPATEAASVVEGVAPAADVVTRTVTEDSTRSSDQDFNNTVSAAPRADDGGLTNLEKAGLLLLGAVVVGAILNNNEKVVANTGDRVVVQDPNGDYRVYKDDDVLLMQPGANVRTETFSDGSTRSFVTRADGTKIVTIRDADGRVQRRVHVGVNGA